MKSGYRAMCGGQCNRVGHNKKNPLYHAINVYRCVRQLESMLKKDLCKIVL